MTLGSSDRFCLFKFNNFIYTNLNDFLEILFSFLIIKMLFVCVYIFLFHTIYILRKI